MVAWGIAVGGRVLRGVWAPVRWLLGMPPPRAPLPTRMRADDVAVAAGAVAAEAGLPFGAMPPQVRMSEGRLLWWVDSATVGGGWRIEVDDATGVAGEVGWWGGR